MRATARNIVEWNLTNKRQVGQGFRVKLNGLYPPHKIYTAMSQTIRGSWYYEEEYDAYLGRRYTILVFKLEGDRAAFCLTCGEFVT